MYFDFNLKSSILLIFFSQGIVFTYLLLKKGIENDSSSSKWLSLFVLLCSLYIAPFMFGYGGWYSKKMYREILFFIPFQQLFLIGPVLYYYTQSLLNKSFQIHKKDWVHFIPALLYAVYSLIIFITDKIALDQFYFYADGRDKDLALWYQIAGLVSMVFYLVLSLKYYNTYKRLAFETVSYAESILFKWLKHFFIAFLIILVLRVLFFILNPEWWQFGRKFWYYLCFSFLFYYIALSGYANTVKAAIPIIDKEANGDAISEKKEKPVIAELPDLDKWKLRLEGLMEADKLYQNPSLSLSDMAGLLEIPSKTMSRLVNQGFQLNFNDFVNGYRVKAVIVALEAGGQSTKTLLGIALECGFNSKATFNRAFKKHTGLSPKEYVAKLS